MVDYTKDTGTGGGVGIYLAAGLVVLVLLYALFAGGGTSTSSDPALVVPDATETAPAVADPAPAIISE